MCCKDSIVGQVVTSVVTAAIVGIGGFFAGKAVAPDVPPTAVIAPVEITLGAGENVQFSAEGSSTRGQSPLTFSWRIGGHPANESSVGYCLPQSNPALASCQFVLPGTFSVSVTVEDGNGLSATATAPVTVSLPNGYVGVVLFSSRPPAEAAEAYRIVLRVIDWRRVQQHVSRPIVIFDPDRGSPVFASSVMYQPATDVLQLDVIRGARLIIPPLAREARALIQTPIENLGGSVTVVPFAEIPKSVEAGLADSGLLGFSSPEEYLNRVQSTR
ncbi:MAG: PKD domain-containing protein [Deltaproteobacteria bacterium]|nr:PKD domain-containing protein [Deltaproteobacteria bacterium]